ncbi:MAG: DUF3570 domain-containing protein [Inhella sp.]
MNPRAASRALLALTGAALALPGLAPAAHAQPAAASDAPAVALQWGHHQDASRRSPDAPQAAPRLRADTLLFKVQSPQQADSGWVLSLTQDSWSGATPVATAPRSAQGNRPWLDAGLVIGGASPMLTGTVMLDRENRPQRLDRETGQWVPDTELVHTLATASPETRRQLDAQWRHRNAWGELRAGGGFSDERDFQSRFAHLEQSLSFNEEQGTLSLGASHTRNQIRATLDHDAAPYLTKGGQAAHIENRRGLQVFQGQRQEWTLSAGMVHALNPGALLELRLLRSGQRGELSDPYRATTVLFAPPAPGALRSANLQSLLEQRPDQRRQWQLDGQLILHLPGPDAALHLGLGRFADDWGVRARCQEVEWFQPLAGSSLLSLRAKRYRQSAASFYTPYLVTAQAYRELSVDAQGQPVIRNYDARLLPAHFSSDVRLASQHTRTLGLGWSTPLGGAWRLELGIERTHQSSAAGSGSGIAYTSAHLGLGLGLEGPSPPSGAHVHTGHAASAPLLPAGVQAPHLGEPAGHWMLGWRLMQTHDAEPLRQHGRPVSDAEVAEQACQPARCSVRPLAMTMRMQMLELGRSLGPRTHLMLMPQFVQMRMDMRPLEGVGVLDPSVHHGRHESAALGDTQLHLHQVLTTPDAPAQWVLGLGLSAPTGRVGLRTRRAHQQEPQALDFGMQTGSGTWDLLPSLSALGRLQGWDWGLQLSGSWRFGRNSAGYALGDRQQAQAWLARPLAEHWALSLRVAHTRDAGLRGQRRVARGTQSPADFEANQGGRLTEAGAGLLWTRLPAPFAAGRLALEWTEPLAQRVRGTQLGRSNGLLLSWSQPF